MRIYPDPELPDVDVEWLAEDCRAGDEMVYLALDGLDSTTHIEMTVACTAVKATFEDVKRERFVIRGELRDANGTTVTENEYEVDLRHGLDQTAYLYFGAFDTFRVAWTFDMGASCASLGARDVEISFSDQFGYQFPCQFAGVSGSAPDGDFTVILRAKTAEGTPVAESQPVDVTFDSQTLTDLGTLTLYPL